MKYSDSMWFRLYGELCSSIHLFFILSDRDHSNFANSETMLEYQDHNLISSYDNYQII